MYVHICIGEHVSVNPLKSWSLNGQLNGQTLQFTQRVVWNAQFLHVKSWCSRASVLFSVNRWFLTVNVLICLVND
jgi:hypothetical protein